MIVHWLKKRDVFFLSHITVQGNIPVRQTALHHMNYQGPNYLPLVLCTINQGLLIATRLKLGWWVGLLEGKNKRIQRGHNCFLRLKPRSDTYHFHSYSVDGELSHGKILTAKESGKCVSSVPRNKDKMDVGGQLAASILTF